MLLYMTRLAPYVGQQTHSYFVVLDNKLTRFFCIVRNWRRPQGQRTDGKRFMGRYLTNLDVTLVAKRGRGLSTMRHINWNSVAPSKGSYPSYVIAVFVCN
jgi:hypothetical protein